MKKIVIALLGMALLFAAASCNNGGGSSSPSLYDRINGGQPSVDLNGGSYSEDVSIDKPVTVRNADFGGKTITITTAGVTLDNIKNANIVLKGAAADVAISGSDICLITVQDIETAITLGSSTNVGTLALASKPAEIIGSAVGAAPTIGMLSVPGGAGSVSVGGVSIASVSVEKGGSGSLPVIVVSAGGTTIGTVSVTQGGAAVSESVGIVVTEAAGEFQKPSGTAEAVVRSARLETDGARTVYELGDAFDFSGLKVTVAYSNGATATVGLSPSNAKVSGFSSLAVGTYTVEFTYNGIPVTGSLRVVVNAITSGYKKLLDEGADLLAKGSFDEAVVKINAAYESSKNDTTKMYYALAQLALISVDDGVQNIMRNNFGVTNYPDKLNALINGEWLKEYKYYEEVRAYNDPVRSDDGGYVRCNLKRSDASADGAVQIFCYDYYEQFPEYDGKWIDGWNVRDYELDGLMADGGSYTADLDVNGSYLISYWTLSNYYYQKYQDPETYEPTTEYYKWEEFIKPYRYERPRESNTYIKVAGGGHSSLPQYKIPSWIQNADSYKDSLFGSAQSAQTASLLMLANIIDLNTSGLNSLVDNVLAVFSDRFDTAKALAASMSEQSVALPRQLVDALNLTEVLGDDEMIVIGKAELNVVIAALEMVKGTFEWLSSYDFSADFSALKTDIYNMGREDGYKVLFSAPTAGFLGVRNKDAMERSKSTYCGAAQLLLDSYDYITGPSSSYPPAAKDAVKETGDAIYQTVRTICDAIESGGTVYFTSNGADSFVGTGAQDSDFGINFGKLFTPGALSDMFKKSGGKLQPYYSYEIEIDCFKEGDGRQYKKKRSAPLPAPASYADIKAVVAAAEDAFKQELEGEGWNVSWSDNYISVGYKVDESVLGGILISDDISTFFKENILPLF